MGLPRHSKIKKEMKSSHRQVFDSDFWMVDNYFDKIFANRYSAIKSIDTQIKRFHSNPWRMSI
jgi:hypothetical protein